MKTLRRDMQLIAQDPLNALDPRMTVRQLVGEELRIRPLARGSELDDQVAAMLRAVGLRPDDESRLPHQFSGGQCQRIGIARALVLRPRFVVADEPVSALDVSVQSQVINLLVELKREFGLTYLFVAHDLAVVDYVADRIAVMYLGKVVEVATAAGLRASCQTCLHPGPAIRNPAARWQRPGVSGSSSPARCPVPLTRHRAAGSGPRCPIAEPVCAQAEPPLYLLFIGPRDHMPSGRGSRVTGRDNRRHGMAFLASRPRRVKGANGRRLAVVPLISTRALRALGP